MAIRQHVSATRKRRYKRSYKIYHIQYGPKGTEHRANARRLSEAGLFIDSNAAVYAIDTPLVINIEIDGEVYTVRGMVRNSRKIDPRFIRLLKPGMGIEFTEVSPQLRTVLSHV